MPELYPLTFDPIFQERLWGADNLARLYGKRLPVGRPIGESWEVVDRADAASVVNNGQLAGKSLRWLMENHPDGLLGKTRAAHGRFPLIVKIIDAAHRLSLQVHPPAGRAEELGGEPKSELWYVAQARAGAQLVAGLKKGTTRAEFERRIRDGTTAECVHQFPVNTGDAMLIPAGRLHAIGGGVVIFEIQQNSDTTYRVFDWNRTDAAGRPRALHIEQSLCCIDFNDFEPGLLRGQPDADSGTVVADHELFRVELGRVECGRGMATEGAFVILGVASGAGTLEWEAGSLALTAGSFCLVPSVTPEVLLRGAPEMTYLCVRPGVARGSQGQLPHP